MSRRIEVELTSARDDGTWTWRAAGAREPRGVVDANLLPQDAKVGAVLRVEADFDLDGIAILAVLPAKGARKEPERLELLGSGRAFEPVTQALAPGQRRRDGEGRRDRDRGPRGDRPDRGPRQGDRTSPAGERGPRPGGERGPRGDRPGGPRSGGDRPRGDRTGGPGDGPRERRDRPQRPPVPELPTRPKPKRLRPGRTHSNEVLKALPDEQRPIAEQVLRGGIPAVRQALQEQNERLKAEGKPEIKPQGVVALAEELLPRIRVADWLDRAEAALADLDELDLRDLRSVVAAAEDPVVARDEGTRDLAARLKDGLANRQEKEHQDWLADIEASLGVGRVVRALRLSSRPPKAGVRFPVELGARLAEATAASLTNDASSDRWVAVLDALALSPVHASVTPASVPANVSDELKSVVTRLAGYFPEIATRLGVEPPAPGTRPPRPARRPTQKRSDRPLRPPAPPPRPAAEAPAAPGTDAPSASAPAAGATSTEAPTAPAADHAPTAPAADHAPTAEAADRPTAPAAAFTDEAPAVTAPAVDEAIGSAEPGTSAPVADDDAASAAPSEPAADHAPTAEAAGRPTAAAAAFTDEAPAVTAPAVDEAIGSADDPHGAASEGEPGGTEQGAAGATDLGTAEAQAPSPDPDVPTATPAPAIDVVAPSGDEPTSAVAGDTGTEDTGTGDMGTEGTATDEA